MQFATAIAVQKAGAQVFHAEAGRFGRKDSAICDYLCFASAVIGAAYTDVEDASNRLATMGYRTTFIQ